MIQLFTINTDSWQITWNRFTVHTRRSKMSSLAVYLLLKASNNSHYTKGHFCGSYPYGMSQLSGLNSKHSGIPKARIRFPAGISQHKFKHMESGGLLLTFVQSLKGSRNLGCLTWNHIKGKTNFTKINGLSR